MSAQHEVAEAVGYYHDLLVGAWTDETAHPGYRPLPEDMPPSYGQCAVTACVLLEELQRDFPGEEMALAAGRVVAVQRTLGGSALGPLIDDHWWINWHGRKLEDVRVIDVTADQARTAALVTPVVTTHDRLLESGIAYATFKEFSSVEDALVRGGKSNLPQRYELLKSRLEERRSATSITA